MKQIEKSVYLSISYLMILSKTHSIIIFSDFWWSAENSPRRLFAITQAIVMASCPNNLDKP
jgi:hypothetical protein